MSNFCSPITNNEAIAILRNPFGFSLELIREARLMGANIIETQTLRNSVKSEGVEMIIKKRLEQITKHGFDSEHDDSPDNKHGELAQAAAYTLSSSSTQFASWPGDSYWVDWPDSWDDYWQTKIDKKSPIEQLAIAGAFCAAEIDRLKRLEKKNEKS